MSAPTSQCHTWKVATPGALQRSLCIMKRQRSVSRQMNVAVTSMELTSLLGMRQPQKRIAQNVSAAPQDQSSAHQSQAVLVSSTEQDTKWAKLWPMYRMVKHASYTSVQKMALWLLELLIHVQHPPRPPLPPILLAPLLPSQLQLQDLQSLQLHALR